mmetsp:Transcript_32704/g.37360  ORF Transcript_32704/g.37360 Transcript_32704/m.37360 type:complete len:134 (+) Transcript_32704:2-403(+)
MERVVRASSSADRLVIIDSQLKVENKCDFNKGINCCSYSTTYLCLANGVSSIPSLKGRPERLFHIVEGIASSSLSESLEILAVGGASTCIGEEKARAVLDIAGLTHVRVAEGERKIAIEAEGEDEEEWNFDPI